MPYKLNPSNIFLSLMQDLDTEVVIATARGTDTTATAVSANVIVDERQMNALFLDVVSRSSLNSSTRRATHYFILAAPKLVYLV